MSNNNTLSLILTAGLLFGCTIDKIELSDNFLETKKGVTSEIIGDLVTKLPANFEMFGSKFLITNPYSMDEVLTILDSKSLQKVFSWGSIGNGPNEFVSPFPERFNKKNNILTILDYGKDLMNEIKISDDSIFTINTIPNRIFGEETILDIFRLSEDRFLIRHYNENEILLEIYDSLGNIISETKICPIRNECNMSRANCMYHFIEEKNILIIGLAETGYISSYNFNGNRLNLAWERFITDPKYTIADGLLKWDKNTNMTGFWHIKSDSNYIYALYAGYIEPPADKRLTTAPSVILKFGLDGSPKEKILLDTPIMNFCLGENNTEIYGIGISPDFNIRRFSIIDMQ